MQIVIEIANDIVDCLNNGIGITNCQYKSLVDAITNGTPLPKGHGRLIECERLQEVFRRNVVGYAGFKQLFDSAPTIIEADKESAEE